MLRFTPGKAMTSQPFLPVMPCRGARADSVSVPAGVRPPAATVLKKRRWRRCCRHRYALWVNKNKARPYINTYGVWRLLTSACLSQP